MELRKQISKLRLMIFIRVLWRSNRNLFVELVDLLLDRSFLFRGGANIDRALVHLTSKLRECFHDDRMITKPSAAHNWGFIQELLEVWADDFSNTIGER